MSPKSVTLQEFISALNIVKSEHGADIPVYLGDGEYGYGKIVILFKTTTAYEELPEKDYPHVVIALDHTAGDRLPLLVKNNSY